MDNIVSALDAFLPYPVYEFRGGPFDGQRREVRLIDLGDDRGYICPDIWKVQNPTPLPMPNYGIAPVNDVAVSVSTYRFVRSARRNQGHYEFVAPNDTRP